MRIDSKKLRFLMMENCMTVEALAKAAGIGSATVNILLHRERKANLSTIGKVAKALNVAHKDLIKEE